MGRCSAVAGAANVFAVGTAFVAAVDDDASFHCLLRGRRPPAATTPTGVREGAAWAVRGNLAPLQAGGAAATAALAEAERRREAGIAFSVSSFSLCCRRLEFPEPI